MHGQVSLWNPNFRHFLIVMEGLSWVYASRLLTSTFSRCRCRCRSRSLSIPPCGFKGMTDIFFFVDPVNEIGSIMGTQLFVSLSPPSAFLQGSFTRDLCSENSPLTFGFLFLPISSSHSTIQSLSNFATNGRRWSTLRSRAKLTLSLPSCRFEEVSQQSQRRSPYYLKLFLEFELGRGRKKWFLSRYL